MQLNCIKIQFLGYLCFLEPGPGHSASLGPSSNLYLTTLAPIHISLSRPSIFIYRPWLIKIENNKSQRLYIMLLFLFLLSNSFVTVIPDINEKSNLSEKQINR